MDNECCIFVENYSPKIFYYDQSTKKHLPNPDNGFFFQENFRNRTEQTVPHQLPQLLRIEIYGKDYRCNLFVHRALWDGRFREEAILQTARNFLELGISIADIMKATGLSEEQIRGAE